MTTAFLGRDDCRTKIGTFRVKSESMSTCRDRPLPLLFKHDEMWGYKHDFTIPSLSFDYVSVSMKGVLYFSVIKRYILLFVVKNDRDKQQLRFIKLL